MNKVTAAVQQQQQYVVGPDMDKVEEAVQERVMVLPSSLHRADSSAQAVEQSAQAKAAALALVIVLI